MPITTAQPTKTKDTDPIRCPDCGLFVAADSFCPECSIPWDGASVAADAMSDKRAAQAAIMVICPACEKEFDGAEGTGNFWWTGDGSVEYMRCPHCPADTYEFSFDLRLDAEDKGPSVVDDAVAERVEFGGEG